MAASFPASLSEANDRFANSGLLGYVPENEHYAFADYWYRGDEDTSMAEAVIAYMGDRLDDADRRAIRE